MLHVRRILVACASAAVLSAGAVHAQVETTIYNIQQGMHPLTTVCVVRNVIVIGVDIKPGSYGVYIQEQGGGAYSGLLAFTNTVFPAYTAGAGTPQVGDRCDVEGTYTEFGGLTELTTPTLTKISTGAAPAPVNLPIDSLKTNYAGSERWEGVLIRVDSVQVTSLNAFNDWRVHHFAGPVAGRVDSLVGYEKMIAGQVVPEVGDRLSVIGVGDFAFSERRIAPRNDADITFLTPAPAAVPNLAYSSSETQIKVRFNVSLNVADAQTPSKYSLSTLQPITAAAYNAATKTVTLTVGSALVPSTTPHVLSMSGIRNSQGVPMNDPQTISFIGGISTITFIQTPKSASNDSSQVANQQVTFRGVVTASTVGASPAFPPATGGFYVQQRGTTQFGGIFVFGAPSPPAKNDSVLVSGIVTEFGVGPETEITSVDEVTVLGTNRPPIAPPSVALADAAGPVTDAIAERYEGMLIRIANVRSLTTASFGEPFDIATSLAGSDTLNVDDLAVEESAYAPWRNDNLDVIGIIRFSGTAPFRRLQPRNWNEPPTGDIHVISKANVSDTAPGVRTQLLQNHPNPFNPTTEIHFELERAGRAVVTVYDVDGKHVRTLWNGPAAAGTNRVLWDGRNAAGHGVGTGVYFYRLDAGDVVQTRKMMLLK